jgi:hypothetical protein
MRGSRVAARAAGVVLVLMLVPAPATHGSSVPPTSKDHLEAAMAHVDERLHVAGWPSPPNLPRERPHGPAAGSPIADECGYDAFGNLRSVDWFFPGERARAFAEGFERQTPVGDAMHFEGVEVLAVSVDETGRAAIEEFVDAVGSPEHGQCMDHQIDTLYERNYIEVTTVEDLGIGDQSGQLWWKNLEYSVGDYYLGDSYTVARTGNTVVIIYYFVVGWPYSAFDPVAEMREIIGFLDGAGTPATTAP